MVMSDMLYLVVVSDKLKFVGQLVVVSDKLKFVGHYYYNFAFLFEATFAQPSCILEADNTPRAVSPAWSDKSPT